MNDRKKMLADLAALEAMNGDIKYSFELDLRKKLARAIDDNDALK